MKAIIHPSNISGTMHAPASKSAMQRACAAALLVQGPSIVQNPGRSNDDKAALEIIKTLGATVEIRYDGSLKIGGCGKRLQPATKSLDCGESGLSFRMFAPIAAMADATLTLTGSGSLVNRPMDFFDSTLPQLGVEVQSTEGRSPLQLTGPLHPKTITIDGSMSSQFLTGLLFAYAGSGAKDVSIIVNNLTSKPYIDLTLNILASFGLPVPENKDYKEFKFQGPSNNTQAIEYTVEGDWSSASFLLVAGALAGSVTVKGLDVFSSQADKGILQALQQSGARLSIETSQIEVGHGRLQPFQFNAVDCPDLFPPLVALASGCNGTSVIEGVHRLKHKESDRASTLQSEFTKLGVGVRLQDDYMIIEGGNKISSASVSSQHDHRIAMACAIAALTARGEVVIDDAEAINKSYPDFYKDIKGLGARLSLNT